VLSGETLLAIDRAVGIWLPAFACLESADPTANPDLVDVAEHEVAELADLAEAFHQAILAVEMVVDRDAAAAQYALSEGASGARAQLEALPRGQVRCTLLHVPLIDAVADIAALPVDASTDGPVWTIAASAYNRCGDLAVAGDEDGAIAVLAAAGVAEPTAKAWVAALCGRGSSASVTAVRRFAGGRMEAGELRWLADTFGGAWRIEPAPAGFAAGEPAYALSPVTGNGLYQGLDELCGGQRA
jgi:hypothetical protein